MGLLLLILTLCFSPHLAEAKPIVIAVIDTGFAFNIKSLPQKHLCKYGHKDFTNDQKFAKYLNTKDKVPQDYIGHGTQIVGIIDRFANNGNYCFVIIKFYSGTPVSSEQSKYSENAFKYIANLNPDIVNYSAGGIEFDQLEYNYIEKYLNNGGIFLAAAGNNGQDLGEKPNTFYPAMYDKRIIVVGNLENKANKNPSSNYGSPVTRWEIGTNVSSYGLTATGTSQATATATGKIVRQLLKGKNGTQSNQAKETR